MGREIGVFGQRDTEVVVEVVQPLYERLRELVLERCPLKAERLPGARRILEHRRGEIFVVLLGPVRSAVHDGVALMVPELDTGQVSGTELPPEGQALVAGLEVDRWRAGRDNHAAADRVRGAQVT